MANTSIGYVAHVSEDGSRTELVRTHLCEVAEMAGTFADAFGAEEWGYAAGILHDIGKYSKEFQRRIVAGGPRVDHSTAGAFVAASNCSPLVAYCVAGHHSGLPDGGVTTDYGSTLQGRIRKAKNGDIPVFEDYACEIEVPEPLGFPFPVDKSKVKDPDYCKAVMYEWGFFTRMLYSCLVDADYLCTERFVLGQGRERPRSLSLREMCDRLEERIAHFWPPQSKLNEIRCGVLDDCSSTAVLDPGVFSLTVPTGGGKTLAFMRFALRHATAIGRSFDRVIVALPYTSIIEQNAEVYRSIFGQYSVLEHHTNYEFEDTETSLLRLAAENWDVPLVVTTNVQLFESLYANKPSRCRKLHSIARSVIVLDEAQMIPTQYLKPCVKALSELVKHYGCTVVLSTATQPGLDNLFELEGLKVREIARCPNELVESLRRITYRNLGTLEDDELIDQLLSCNQVLCIVNSRRQARILFDLVSHNDRVENESVFHLSTFMYPEHRSRTIELIRQRLSAGSRCIVVATSLVEAGVDLDFETVFREMTGIDSLVQAAGRCNREMRHKSKDSMVYVFESTRGYKKPIDVMQRAQVARSVLEGMQGDGTIEIDSLGVIEDYFQNLYFYRSLDDKGIVDQMSSCKVLGIPFESVAEQFRLVEDKAYTVIVPTASNTSDVRELASGHANRHTMRRLSRFAVGVYKQDLDRLWRSGTIEEMGENVYLLRDSSLYKEDVGLCLNETQGEAVFL